MQLHRPRRALGAYPPRTGRPQHRASANRLADAPEAPAHTTHPPRRCGQAGPARSSAPARSQDGGAILARPCRSRASCPGRSSGGRYRTGVACRSGPSRPETAERRSHRAPSGSVPAVHAGTVARRGHRTPSPKPRSGPRVASCYPGAGVLPAAAAVVVAVGRSIPVPVPAPSAP